MQAPLIRYVNDDPDAWASLWHAGVRYGMIPYYMFVERDTGARNYFEVPLVRAYGIFKEAYSQVSGLSRSVRGPSMSAFPGKVRILGVVTLRDLIDSNMLDAIRDGVGFDLLGDPSSSVMACDFIQARNPAWVRKPFFAEFDDSAVWFDDLQPAFGKRRFLLRGEGPAAAGTLDTRSDRDAARVVQSQPAPEADGHAGRPGRRTTGDVEVVRFPCPYDSQPPEGHVSPGQAFPSRTPQPVLPQHRLSRSKVRLTYPCVS